MLCYFNRLATDDYYFIWDVRHHGIITGVTSQYMEWCGRFAATFAMDVFYKLFDLRSSYYSLFPFLSVTLIAGGVYFLLNNFRLLESKKQTLLAAISFTALLFFLSFDIGESWFWFCAQSSYMWSIIAFIWACVFLSNTKFTALSTLFALLCFVYIGGSSEVYAVIYGLFFTYLLYFNYKKAGTLKSFMFSNKKLLITYLVFALAFLIFLVAPGNYLRDGLFPKHEFLYSFFITAKSFVKFGVFYLPFKLPYIIAFATPFIFVGNACKSSQIIQFQLSFKSFFLKISSLFIATLFIFYFIVAYVMVETGPARMVFFVSFLFSIYCCLLFFYLGYKSVLKEKQEVIFKNVSIALGIALLLFNIEYQYPITRAYAAAYDERTENIIDLNKKIEKDTLILLKPLPPCGMLYSTEISTDTSHFTNRELRFGYELKFHVALNR